METEYLLMLMLFAVLIAVPLFSYAFQTRFSEVWLDTSQFRKYYSAGEVVTFQVDIKNSLGAGQMYTVNTYLDRNQLESFEVFVDSGDTAQVELSFNLYGNVSLPTKISVEVLGLDTLSLWVFNKTTLSSVDALIFHDQDVVMLDVFGEITNHEGEMRDYNVTIRHNDTVLASETFTVGNDQSNNYRFSIPLSDSEQPALLTVELESGKLFYRSDIKPTRVDLT